ncbi:MAG TPA: hypothetical protein VOA00_10625, partial [Thermoanaerobaculia bacterium]|nr:hypothetical protein [Thermoanaerobaculia bacterium]
SRIARAEATLVESSRSARAEATLAESSRIARAEIDFFDVETAGLFPTLPTRISVMTFPVADLIFAL